MKHIDKYLYEKEISALKKQNANLLARCERAEKYSKDFEALCEQNKRLSKEYKEKIQKLKKLEKELENYRDSLWKKIEKER